MDRDLYLELVRERCPKGLAKLVAQQQKDIDNLKKKVEFMYNSNLFGGGKGE